MKSLSKDGTLSREKAFQNRSPVGRKSSLSLVATSSRDRDLHACAHLPMSQGASARYCASPDCTARIACTTEGYLKRKVGAIVYTVAGCRTSDCNKCSHGTATRRTDGMWAYVRRCTFRKSASCQSPITPVRIGGGGGGTGIPLRTSEYDRREPPRSPGGRLTTGDSCKYGNVALLYVNPTELAQSSKGCVSPRERRKAPWANRNGNVPTGHKLPSWPSQHPHGPWALPRFLWSGPNSSYSGQ